MPSQQAVPPARIAGNKRLRDALYLQAFSALQRSHGVRVFCDAHRARGHTHHQALRALANRLVGILHGCLHHRTHYDEATAWLAQQQLAAADFLQAWDVLVEATGGIALIAAAHRGLVWLTHGVRPSGHRGAERLNRGMPSSR